MTLHKVKNYQF